MHPAASTLALLIAAGFTAGFVDSIAGGGGIISLPALLAAGVPPHIALGTNKLQAVLGTALATANYARRGLIQRSQLPLGVAFTAAGALTGALLVTRIPSDWLARIAPWLLFAVFLYMLQSPRLGDAERRARLGENVFSVVFGLALGFYDGFFGPGAGSFWTIAFLGLLGFALPRATANTKAMNLTSNAVAFAWFAAHGDVAWRLGLEIAVANIAGAAIGSSLAIEKGARLIRVFFLIAVAATVARLVWKTLAT